MSSSHLISPHLSSSHLAPSLLTCHLSKFFSTVFISSERWSTFLISPKFFSTHLSSFARQKDLTVREVSCTRKTLGAESFCTQKLWDTGAFTQKSLSNILCTTKLSCLHKALPSTTLYALYFPVLSLAACTKHFPVRLCTLCTSQCYFVLQSLQKVLPCTTLYYEACTKHVLVLLCTTKLAQSTS